MNLWDRRKESGQFYIMPRMFHFTQGVSYLRTVIETSFYVILLPYQNNRLTLFSADNQEFRNYEQGVKDKRLQITS